MSLRGQRSKRHIPIIIIKEDIGEYQITQNRKLGYMASLWAWDVRDQNRTFLSWLLRKILEGIKLHKTGSWVIWLPYELRGQRSKRHIPIMIIKEDIGGYQVTQNRKLGYMASLWAGEVRGQNGTFLSRLLRKILEGIKLHKTGSWLYGFVMSLTGQRSKLQPSIMFIKENIEGYQVTQNRKLGYMASL